MFSLFINGVGTFLLPYGLAPAKLEERFVKAVDFAPSVSKPPQDTQANREKGPKKDSFLKRVK